MELPKQPCWRCGKNNWVGGDIIETPIIKRGKEWDKEVQIAFSEGRAPNIEKFLTGKTSKIQNFVCASCGVNFPKFF